MIAEKEGQKPAMKAVQVQKSVAVADRAGIEAILAQGFQKLRREKSKFNSRFYQVMVRTEYHPVHENDS